MTSFLCLENASKIKVQNVRHLCELILDQKLRRHRRMPKDQFKLPSEIYNIVDLVYDGDNRYVPNCFVCKHCSYLMYVPKAGGNSKLRKHACVKKFMDEDANHTDEIYLNHYFLTSAQRDVLANVFAGLTRQAKMKSILPIDWSPQSWYGFLTKLQFNPNASAENRNNDPFAVDFSEVQDDSDDDNNEALDHEIDSKVEDDAGPLDDKESDNEDSGESNSNANAPGDNSDDETGSEGDEDAGPDDIESDNEDSGKDSSNANASGDNFEDKTDDEGPENEHLDEDNSVAGPSDDEPSQYDATPMGMLTRPPGWFVRSPFLQKMSGKKNTASYKRGLSVHQA